MSDQQTELDRLRAENDALRAIAAKIMPCHYCGVDTIGKCPHGFPGCALADDIACYDERISIMLKEAVAAERESPDTDGAA